MAMLLGWRRYFAIVAFLLLATPLIVGLVRPDGPAAVLKEGRSLAPAPRMPGSSAAWIALPKKVDDYLRDHFGLRQALITAHRELTKPMLGFGNDSVLVGRDGRMFYLGDSAVRQSAGLLVRDRGVADTLDFLAAMNDDLKRRGIRFLVASPPNAATVYQSDLPDWAQASGRRTEYDLFVEGLAEKGVKTVDLRPVMAAAKPEGPIYYRHDSHWTPRGALAAFNAIVEGDGHPDWRLDQASVLTPLSVRKGGDLARMLGVQDSVTETVEGLKLPVGEKQPLTAIPWEDYVESSGRPGPTVMIIGDSFTTIEFAIMLLQHVGRVVWIDHQHCRFDPKVIDRFHPDEVWWMPNERFFICDPGARTGRLRRMSVRSLLVIGGARSGKSAYAQSLRRPMGPSDSIWRPRRRETRKWRSASPATRPTEVGAGRRSRSRSKSPARSAAEARPGRVIVVDCLTLWLSNLMFEARDPAPAIAGLADSIAALAGPAILVSNEVGMGLVPDHKLGREFRDWQGRTNREIARACDAVVFVAAGLPLQLKPAATPSVQLG